MLSGGITSFTMKSGTNDLHGTGFWFVRNEIFDARGFFNSSRAPAKQNEWGGTIGGPIFKDRTFFFSDYQGHREKQGLTFLSTVPTLAMS